MKTETKTALSQKTVEALQDLIQVNIDSSKGFREIAEIVDDTSLEQLFRGMADVREQNQQELQEFVKLNNEEPRGEGSYAAALHRVWVNLRSKLSGGDKHVILSEAEKGEDYIKQAYESCLVETSGSAMNDVLMQQYAHVKEGHDQIRELRDCCASDKCSN